MSGYIDLKVLPKYKGKTWRFFTFGKYKNRSVIGIMRVNISYIEWLLNNYPHFKLEPDEYYYYLKLKQVFKVQSSYLLLP